MRNNKKALNVLQHIIILIPAIVYLLVVNKYAVSLPSLDDYDAVLRFLCDYKAAHGLDKLFMLFEQQNEHRIFFPRVVFVVYEVLMGHINFRNLIFIGNLQLLLTFIIWVALIKKALPKYWFAAALVAGICLFDLNNWENADFATGSVQNFGILFLFSAGLFFYDAGGKWSTALAVLFHIVCTFSSGNGIIASGCLLLFNILNKNKINLYFSILVVVVCCPLYFVHYNRVEETMKVAPAINVVRYFFQFVSNHIYYDNNAALSVGVGVGIIISLLLLLPLHGRLSVKEHTAPFVALLGFVLASAVLISIFRTSFGYYIPSRYLEYPHFLVMLLFVFLLLRLQGRKWIMSVAIVYLTLVLITYNMNFRGGITGFVAIKGRLDGTNYDYPNQNTAKELLERSCRSGIFCVMGK